MKVTAAVYQQATPTVVKPVRHFLGPYGERLMEHEANLIHIGNVIGTHSECWAQAKAMTRYPVLEFQGNTYKERYHVPS